MITARSSSQQQYIHKIDAISRPSPYLSRPHVTTRSCNVIIQEIRLVTKTRSVRVVGLHSLKARGANQKSGQQAIGSSSCHDSSLAEELALAIASRGWRWRSLKFARVGLDPAVSLSRQRQDGKQASRVTKRHVSVLTEEGSIACCTKRLVREGEPDLRLLMGEPVKKPSARSPSSSSA